MYMIKWFMVALLHAERCLVFSVPPLSAVVMSCLGVWIPPAADTLSDPSYSLQSTFCSAFVQVTLDPPLQTSISAVVFVSCQMCEQ